MSRWTVKIIVTDIDAETAERAVELIYQALPDDFGAGTNGDDHWGVYIVPNDEPDEED